MSIAGTKTSERVGYSRKKKLSEFTFDATIAPKVLTFERTFLREI